MKKTDLAASLLAATILTLTPLSPAFAHGKASHAAKIGQKGDASVISRTVEITMTDNRFEPGILSVKPGETVRFIVKNAGELVHEFNIGNREMHAAHGKEMMMMMEIGVLEADRINHDMMAHGSKNAMKHDDPNSVLLEPAKVGEVIWAFPESGQLQVACNVPGHYQDGMVGTITIVGSKKS